ncbi:MAG: hypothetical protein C4516_08570 [Oxalobacter sp.]|nr:MAG: hypothetical protein C4516_08570 [Oxalobacter sp.]
MNARKIFQALLWLVYPLAIFFGLKFFEPWLVASLLAASLILRRFNDASRFLKSISQHEVLIFACMLGLACTSAITNSEILLRLYPAGVSLGMLIIFGLSLKNPPSVVERIARLREPELPLSGVIYTRKVTQFWCGFFVLNGSIAVFTALFASKETWALYNGLIAYLFMGAIFAGEWLVRRFCIQRAA